MRTRIRLCVLALSLAVSSVAWTQETAAEDYAWLKGFTLVELETTDIGSLNAAHALIRSRGGNIALISPPSLLLGWIPEDVSASLIGEKGIRAIHHRAVSPQKVRADDPFSNRMVRYFNAVATGEYQRLAARRKAAASPPRFTPGGDGFERPPIDEVEYLRNLQDQGFDLNALRDRGLLAGKAATDPDRVLGQSDRMTGTSTVTLMFVESDGTNTDPDLYTWTDDAIQEYINGVNSGLAWWSSQALLYNDCWAAFFVRWFDPTADTRLNQWREMVLHGSNSVDNMVVDVMSNFGYNGGSHISRVESFNTAQCATYGTDWAYTAFVAYNPLPAPGQLTDGRSAFAYLLGPYTFLLYRSFGWAPQQVFTHESGHIYGACDEYLDGCSCGSLCIGEQNGNCEDCGAGVSCMMRANTFTLCTYTDEQVGWQDTSPCAPPVLAAPTVISSSPSVAYVGTAVQLTILGTNLLYGAFAQFGSGVQIETTNWVSSDTLIVDIMIEEGAAIGLRDMVVSNRDLQSSTLVGALEILPTTRHYYSVSGGNAYPYITAASAATTLADAISAAAPDDSILVESGTLPMSSLTIGKGVILYGGWTNNFTQRDLVNGKTLLDLTGNVNILVTGNGTGGLDGFEVRNGSGTLRPSPISGNYGGAVMSLSSSVHIGNCEIHLNQPNTGGFGGGGGIYAENATVNFVDNEIHDNTATRGGGIYLRTSGGTVARNTLTNNVVSAAGGNGPVGGGIILEECNNITLIDNVIDGNLGATAGGGMQIVNSNGISIQGGSIAHHTVTNSGAGADIIGSQVDVSDVEFAHNFSQWSSGGAGVTGSSDVVFVSCRFLSNSAVFYGGLFATNSDASVQHNLFAENVSAGSAGALTLLNVGAGDVTGNTLDRNTASGGAGGMRLDNAPIEVTNNIVANSSGVGIECVGTLPTLLDWNLVTNSSGADYTGCAPGTNAVSGNPAFVDTTMTDYHLGVHSAGIDAGRTDLGYDDPDGSRGDLGIYGSHSFTMEQPVFPTGLVAALESGNIVLTWNPNPESNIANYAVYADSISSFKPSVSNVVALVAAPDSSVNLGAPGAASFYTIAAVNDVGYSGGFALEAQGPDATDAPPSGALAYGFRLHANAPNPFNPMTRIPFELDRSGTVRLDVYDLAGRLMRTLVHGSRDAGPHIVVWDGRDQRGERVSSGVYVYRLRSGERERTKKMVVLK